MLPVKKSQGYWLPDLWNDFLDNSWMVRPNATAPAINVIENDKEYKVEIAAPGMCKKDFNILVNDENQLVVTMHKEESSESKTPECCTEGKEAKGAKEAKTTKKEEKEWEKVDKSIEKASGERYLRREFSYSHFQQAMVLPDNIQKEKISAKMDNGVLDIVIPKAAPHKLSAQPRTIEIK